MQPKKLKVLFTTAAILLASTATTYAQVIAYDNGVQPGNQNYPASLGNDFTVNSPIAVTSLGAFASGGAAGFAGTITVGIYTTAGSLVAGPLSFSGSTATSAGTYNDGDWFKTLSPAVVLPAGNYSIVAVGFTSDKDGNSTIAGYIPPTQNTGGGLITFSTQGRYDANTVDTTLTFPTTTGTFQFLAGTFQFALTLSVGPGECVPFPVTLAAPAGPNGAAVTLTSSDATIADFSPGVNPVLVIIEPGATSPTRGEIPQICGVKFGTVKVTASPGVTPVNQTVVVRVAAALSFAYSSYTATAGSDARIELDLSAPAPAGGLTVNLFSNPAVATVPATTVIPAGSTSVIVQATAVAPGSTTISATTSAPNVTGATTSLTVH
jgi:hypothetical protein